MLNEKNERELAYVVTIDELAPIPGYDRVEHARVGGWWVIVRKNQFKVGDLAVYFEIDSRVPATACFDFLAKRKYKIKTQKMCKVLSQGLLMSFEDLGWAPDAHKEHDFVTEELGVTYIVEEDNIRKSKSPNKYEKMRRRHAKLFQHKTLQWLYQYNWGKQILFTILGRAVDKRTWPVWVSKTDEERIQNIPSILQDNGFWIMTEKIDGTSTTFTMHRHRSPLLKRETFDFRVCSRRVCFDTPEKTGFYNTNVYWEMAMKYNIEHVLKTLLISHPDWEWVTLQGETYGADIQKRTYNTSNHYFAGFNLIDSVHGRWNSVDAANTMAKFSVPWVPILDEHFVLPKTVDEMLQIATGASVIDGGMREGVVLRDVNGVRSFKAVSNEFLLKYHV